MIALLIVVGITAMLCACSPRYGCPNASASHSKPYGR